MLSVRIWGWALLAAMLLLSHLPLASAQHHAPTTEPSRGESHDSASHAKPERVGDPLLGVLIIVGLVGLLVFMAWVISRVGEGRKPPSDNTLQ